MGDEDGLANTSDEIASSDQLLDTDATMSMLKPPSSKYPKLMRFPLRRIQ